MKTDSHTAAKAREQRISEIAGRASKAAKHVPLQPDPKEPEYASSCPLCGTGEPELLMSSHDGTRASGVQIFGIGEDLTELEDFVKWSFEDIPFLLAELAATEKRVREACCKAVCELCAVGATYFGVEMKAAEYFEVGNLWRHCSRSDKEFWAHCKATSIRSLELKGE